jgi:hypothetical protein
MMGPVATEAFNRILKEWRRQGRTISWTDLNRAAEMAWEVERAQAEETRKGGNSR